MTTEFYTHTLQAVCRFLLLACASATLLDWQLYIGDRQEFYCSPAYCAVPEDWQVEYPTLIIMHNYPLHVQLLYNHSVIESTLFIELIQAQCIINASLNDAAVDLRGPLYIWHNVSVPLAAAHDVDLTLDVDNCTLALSNLYLMPTEDTFTDTSESIPTPEDDTFAFTWFILAFVLLAAIIVAGIMWYRRPRYFLGRMESAI